MSTTSSNLLDFYHSHAVQIWLARETSKLIHSTMDIKSSGNEVEIAARNVLRELLPKRFHIGHGHIIDTKKHTSPQLDIIISDAENASVLFKAHDGTEYIPFESVYAIGEVRSTFYKPSEIDDFVKHIKTINNDFKRNETKPNEFSDFNLGDNITTNDKRPYKNPLFKFMLFIHGNEIENQIKKLNILGSENLKDLPNLISFMDTGVILNWQVDETKNSITSINSVPEFNPQGKSCWCYRKPKDKDKILGTNLSVLFLVLMNHLQNCTLKKPNLLEYFAEYEIFEENAELLSQVRDNN